MRRITWFHAASLATSLLATSASRASETISCSYDAKGRLVKVAHSGTVNNGVTKDYTHDKADNRKTLKVAGATN